MQDSAPEFVGPDEGSIFVAVGKSAKFSFKFTGDFRKIDFGVHSRSRDFFEFILIRVTKATPLTFKFHPEYVGRISWAGNENVSPVEAVFILSNVSIEDSRTYSCEVNKGLDIITRWVDLIVTGKRLS